MAFLDVVFPLNIGPLTYRLPEGHARLNPGTLIRAQVGKTIRHGVVKGRATSEPAAPSKEIIDVVLDKPVLSAPFMSLLKWMAEYYLSNEGVVLKSMGLIEYLSDLKKTRGTKQETPKPLTPVPELPIASPGIVSSVRRSLLERTYGTFLLHSPSTNHEISYLLEISEGLSNVIVLVPEIAHIRLLFPFLKERLGERLAVLHGNLSKGRRRDTLQRIISGESDVVLGTRIAVFSPLRSVSLISVFQEQNRSYKNLEGVRYNARDVAVMRAYLENATVFLSSTVPSLESFHNTVKGKYTLLSPPGQVGRPRVEIINMKTAKKVTPYLSRRSVQAALSSLRKRQGVLFVINRKGYSLIQCSECDTFPSCPECGIPLVFHKKTTLLRCHYCGYSTKAPAVCARCGSTKLETRGAGTERIADDLKKFLGTEPFRLDRDSMRDDPALRAAHEIMREDEVVVGTRALAGRLREGYGLCVFVNADSKLHHPDFRSHEILFQELCGISEYVRKDGLIIVQTAMPENSLFKFIRSFSFRDFFAKELSARTSLSYPPVSRMIAVTASSRLDMSRVFRNAFNSPGEKIDLIGPIHTFRNGYHVWKVILKSTAKERLTLYAREALRILRAEKGLRIAVDVDPISV